MYSPDERGWLQIALDVHTTNTGSNDRCHEEQEKDVASLKKHLAEWEPSLLSKFMVFDYACRTVMLFAVQDHERQV